MENIDRQFTPIVVKEMKVVMNTFEGYNVENECLGQGGWGKVFAATRKCDQKKFAMKFFGYTNSNPVVEAINSEIVLMMALTGVEGVVSLESVFYDPPEGLMCQKIHCQSYPVIVMETVTGGCLIDRLANETLRQSMSESTIANMFRTAVTAVDSIHRRGFIHRDLKLDNLLLATDDSNSPVKVIDFGLMVQIDHKTRRYLDTKCLGTPGMYAPESIDSREYSTASDVWQLGCIVYSMLTGHGPFPQQQERHIRIRQGRYFTSDSPTYQNLSDQAKDLISRIFIVDPTQRITITELLEHPWMTGSAPQLDLGEVYRHRVKRLAMRQAVKRVLDQPIVPHIFPVNSDHTSSGTADNSAVSIGEGSNVDSQSSMDSLDEMELGLRDPNSPGVRYFSLFDRDHKGFLTRDDLRYGVTALMVQATAAAVDDISRVDIMAVEAAVATKTCPGVRVNIDDMFDIMDTDGNNKIDLDEFLCFYHIVVLPSTIRRASDAV